MNLSDFFPFFLYLYLVGGGGTFLWATAHDVIGRDGYRIAARVIFWPLFAIKSLLKTAWTALLDLCGDFA